MGNRINCSPEHSHPRQSVALALLLVAALGLTLWPSLSFGVTAAPLKKKPLSLTPEEQQYLRAHPVLTMGVGLAFPPFQYVEDDSGRLQFKGLAADVMQLLGQRLGVTFEPVLNISFAEALAMGRAGNLDLFPCLSWTPERAAYLTFTKPYLAYPLVIISRDDAPFIASVQDLAGRRVADVAVLSTYSKVRNAFPDLNIDYVFEKDTPAMLEAVSFGKADACIVDLAVASSIIKTRGLSNLKVAAPTNWEDNELAMAVPKDKAILAGILQKALDSLTPEEEYALRQRWMGLKLATLANPTQVLGVLLPAGVAALLAMAAVLWHNRRLRHEIAGRLEAQEAFRLANAYNRSLFDVNPDSIMATDQQGIITDVNKSTELLTGFARNELVGKDFRVFFTDSAKAASCLLTVFDSGACRDYELDILHKDGSTTPVLYNASAYRGADGTILGAFAAVRDIAERKRMEARLKELATLDSLTRVNNRHSFFELGSVLYEGARRHSTHLAVAMFDIDHFKTVNDNWGHEAGDRVLVRLCRTALDCFRASDLFGRVGGEEFAVVMPETDCSEALQAVERFRHRIAAMSIAYGSQRIGITISCGVAEFAPEKDTSLAAILRRADEALYQAKRQGRNTVVGPPDGL
ncbi:diguanylate cyclase [Solidesulfovibrio sp.]